MNYLVQYVIPFKGIQDGIHFFDFNVESKFFECFESSVITDGNIDVKVELNKTNLLLRMNLHLNGNVKIKCDRCLEDYDYPIDSVYELLVSVTDKEQEDDENIIFIPSDEHEINLAQYIYEYTDLSLPLQKIHPDDEEGYSTCNEEMLDILEDYIIDDEIKEVDPRWEKLLNIKKED